MESPFQLARRIPKDTWKTVTDAWNGYHSVPLRDSDRHLTIFITPFGRWRYTRAPQGFLSSGDRYNRHFDAVLAEFERKERCVDDTVHYDTSTRFPTTPSCATQWPLSSHFSAPAANSCGPPSLSQHFKRPRKPSSKLSARGWKSSTYRGTPASALTGPSVVSVTFSFSNTVVAPPVFQTAAPGDGESHWPVPAS